MSLEGDQWVCNQCADSNTKAGKQSEVDKPRPLSASEIAEGKRKAKEDFEKQKRKNEADEAAQEEQARQKNRPRGG